MKLKLWEKSFLLTFSAFFLLLNVAIVIWVVMNFGSQYRQWYDGCQQEAEQIYSAVERIYEEGGNSGEIERLGALYSRSDTFIRVEDMRGENMAADGNRAVTDYLPEQVPQRYYKTGKMDVGEDSYFYFHSASMIETGQSPLVLVYAKDMDAFFDKQRWTTLWAAVIDLAMGVLVGGLLYMAMRKIYRPVSNISHELRTPLTGIKGYAQYLMTKGLSEEDRLFAQQQIISEADYMKDVVEKMLTMENLRGSQIKKSPIPMGRFLSELQEQYPALEIKNELESIRGDETLVRSLLFNLAGNAVREDGKAQMICSGSAIKFVNHASGLTKQDVKQMNRGVPLSRQKTKGSGYGLSLCKEITRLHRWRLHYELQDGLLTALVVIE
ncbi:MAG: HAMP domain-containing sensor histidine kinase [Bacillota bacterium]|nr:HAMP domain-containing sensor histidine kinase [Bacillota bacterium]